MTIRNVNTCNLNLNIELREIQRKPVKQNNLGFPMDFFVAYKIGQQYLKTKQKKCVTIRYSYVLSLTYSVKGTVQQDFRPPWSVAQVDSIDNKN